MKFVAKLNKNSFIRFWLILFAFSIPWSSFLYRISILFLLVALLVELLDFCICSIKTRHNQFATLGLEYRILLLPVLLYLLVYFSKFWTEAPEFIADWEVQRYLKLLMIPGLVHLLIRYNNGKQENIINAFLVGVVFLITPSFLDFFGIFDFFEINPDAAKNTAYKKITYAGLNLVYHHNQIVHGFMSSVLCLCLAIHAIFNGKHRIYFLFGVCLCLFDISYLIIGRMAVIGLFGSLLLLLLYLPISLKYKIYATASLMILLFVAILINQNLQTRLNSIFVEFMRFWIEGDFTSSGGQRLHFWSISLELFMNNPLWGGGAGAFEHHLISHGDPFAKSYLHTHSEYLTLLSLYGLVGFGLFFNIIFKYFKVVLNIKHEKNKYIFFVFMCIFLINALTDSSLHNEWEGWSFVLFVSIVTTYASSRTTELKVLSPLQSSHSCRRASPAASRR